MKKINLNEQQVVNLRAIVRAGAFAMSQSASLGEAKNIMGTADELDQLLTSAVEVSDPEIVSPTLKDVSASDARKPTSRKSKRCRTSRR